MAAGSADNAVIRFGDNLHLCPPTPLPKPFLVSSFARTKIRWLPLILLTGAAAAPAWGIELISDDPIEYDFRQQELIARGSARLIYEDTFLTANEILYNQQRMVARARGDAVVQYRQGRLIADQLSYDLNAGRAEGENVRFGFYPLFLESEQVEGTREQLTFTDAVFYAYEPRAFSPNVRARHASVTEDRRFRGEGLTFRIGRVPFFYWPSVERGPTEFPADVTLGAGYEKILGTWLRVGVRVPVSDAGRIGVDVDGYSRRGVMAGPGADYNLSRDRYDLSGVFSSGYIADQGELGTDLLDRDISKHRHFIDWRNQFFWEDNLEITIQYKGWSDSSVTRDFRRSLFEREQEPDTFLEANWLGDNTILSFFTRGRPNDFQSVQERLPEVRIDGLNTELAAGIYQNYQLSAANLQERPPPTLERERLRSERLDAYYGLDRPILVGDWMSLTPAAGGRVTHYDRAEGDRDNYTRWLGEVGMDVNFYGYGLYDYENAFWGIDGIRHLVEPKLQYRYIPKADRGEAFIPAIDRRAQSTQLPPLRLGRIRNIDELDEIHSLRFGLDQYFQTRDSDYGSRNLLAVFLANDWRFSRETDAEGNPENEFSDLHSEIVFTPVYWLRFNLFNRLDPEELSVAEINTAVTLTDAQVWALTLGSDYLEDAIEQYAARYSYRLNEVYAVSAQARYDARVHLFTEQRYSLTQRLQNTWDVEYRVTLRNGARRESSAEFGMALSLVRF